MNVIVRAIIQKSHNHPENRSSKLCHSSCTMCAQGAKYLVRLSCTAEKVRSQSSGAFICTTCNDVVDLVSEPTSRSLVLVLSIPVSRSIDIFPWQTCWFGFFVDNNWSKEGGKNSLGHGKSTAKLMKLILTIVYFFDYRQLFYYSLILTWS